MRKKENAELIQGAEPRTVDKGARINLLLTPENHEFIRTVSGGMGKSMTEFINLVIARYRKEHPDLYDLAKETQEKMLRSMEK